MSTSGPYAEFLNALADRLDIARWGGYQLDTLTPEVAHASAMLLLLAQRGDLNRRVIRQLPTMLDGKTQVLREALAYLEQANRDDAITAIAACLDTEQLAFVLMQTQDVMLDVDKPTDDEQAVFDRLREAYDGSSALLSTSLVTLKHKNALSSLGPFESPDLAAKSVPVGQTATMSPPQVLAESLLRITVADGVVDPQQLEYFGAVVQRYAGLQDFAVQQARKVTTDQFLLKVRGLLTPNQALCVLCQCAQLIFIEGRGSQPKWQVFRQLRDAWGLSERDMVVHLGTLKFNASKLLSRRDENAQPSAWGMRQDDWAAMKSGQPRPAARGQTVERADEGTVIRRGGESGPAPVQQRPRGASAVHRGPVQAPPSRAAAPSGRAAAAAPSAAAARPAPAAPAAARSARAAAPAAAKPAAAPTAASKAVSAAPVAPAASMVSEDPPVTAAEESTQAATIASHTDEVTLDTSAPQDTSVHTVADAESEVVEEASATTLDTVDEPVAAFDAPTDDVPLPSEVEQTTAAASDSERDAPVAASEEPAQQEAVPTQPPPRQDAPLADEPRTAPAAAASAPAEAPSVGASAPPSSGQATSPAPSAAPSSTPPAAAAAAPSQPPASMPAPSATAAKPEATPSPAAVEERASPAKPAPRAEEKPQASSKSDTSSPAEPARKDASSDNRQDVSSGQSQREAPSSVPNKPNEPASNDAAASSQPNQTQTSSQEGSAANIQRPAATDGASSQNAVSAGAGTPTAAAPVPVPPTSKASPSPTVNHASATNDATAASAASSSPNIQSVSTDGSDINRQAAPESTPPDATQAIDTTDHADTVHHEAGDKTPDNVVSLDAEALHDDKHQLASAPLVDESLSVEKDSFEDRLTNETPEPVEDEHFAESATESDHRIALDEEEGEANVETLDATSSEENIQSLEDSSVEDNRARLPSNDSGPDNRQRLSADVTLENRQDLPPELPEIRAFEQAPRREAEKVLNRFFETWQSAAQEEPPAVRKKAGFKSEIPPTIHRQRVIDFSSLNIFLEYPEEEMSESDALDEDSLGLEKKRDYDYKLQTCLDILKRQQDVVNDKLQRIRERR